MSPSKRPLTEKRLAKDRAIHLRLRKSHIQGIEAFCTKYEETEGEPINRNHAIRFLIEQSLQHYGCWAELMEKQEEQK
jgi:hypothetical protein